MYLSVDRTTCNDMGGFYPYAVRETGPDFLFVDLYAAHAACKLSDSISCGLMSYKNLKISKDKVVDIIEEPEETGSMEPLQTTTAKSTSTVWTFPMCPESRC